MHDGVERCTKSVEEQRAKEIRRKSETMTNK